MRHSRLRGFNLLEVTIAAFIFSVVAISFIGVWGQQVRALEKSRHVMVATLLAEEMIEDSMAKGYEQLSVSKPTDLPEDDIVMSTYTRNLSDSSNSNNPEDWDEIEVLYKPSIVVTDAAKNDDDKLYQVVVTVTWVDTTKTGKVVLETFVAGSL